MGDEGVRLSGLGESGGEAVEAREVREHAPEARAGQIAPLRDLFLAVFFTSLGMNLDPHTLAQWWWVILLGGMAMSATKAATMNPTM